jgi:hypothetical protein
MSHLTHTCLLVLLASELSGTSACARSSSGGGVAEPQGTATARAVPDQAEEQPGGAPSVVNLTPDVSSLDDASLAAVMQSVHQRLAQQAQLAESRSPSRDVKDASHQFGLAQADMMNGDQSLFERLSLLPRVSPVSTQIDTEGTQTLLALQGDGAGAFDGDYLEAQRRALTDFITMFDRMVSAARSPELKVDVARQRVDMAVELQSVFKLQERPSPGATSLPAPGR